jgi:hypothetical protein
MDQTENPGQNKEVPTLAVGRFWCLPMTNMDGFIRSRHSGLPSPKRLRAGRWKPESREILPMLKNWIPAGVYPDDNRGRNDPIETFYDFINIKHGQKIDPSVNIEYNGCMAAPDDSVCR